MTILNRLKDLINKLLSIKVIVFITSTVILLMGINISIEYLTLCFMVIGGRTFDKFISSRKP